MTEKVIAASEKIISAVLVEKTEGKKMFATSSFQTQSAALAERIEDLVSQLSF